MRKMILLATAAAAALAMTAFAAPANAAIFNVGGEECEQLYVEGNQVGGGCLVQNMEGEWRLEAFGKVYAYCDLEFDFRVDEGSQLYAVNQQGLGCEGIQREPCTDPETEETIPWPGEPVWIPGVGAKEKIDMCFQAPTNPGFGSWEEVTFTAVWDENDYFTDFLQYGESENGYIHDADFENKDFGEGPEIEWVE